MRVLMLLALLIPVAACRSREPIACNAAERSPAFSRDSTVALCAFPGYRLATSTGRLWARGSPTDSSYAWLTVAVLDSSEAASEWGTPPRPGSLRSSEPPTTIHRLTAESVAVHPETVDGRSVRVETGRVTGGFAGWRRKPMLRAAWPLGDGRWVLAQGQAPDTRTLDTLRIMLRSVRVTAARRPRS